MRCFPIVHRRRSVWVNGLLCNILSYAVRAASRDRAILIKPTTAVQRTAEPVQSFSRVHRIRRTRPSSHPDHRGRARAQSANYSGPEVGFEEIAIHFREGRFRVADNSGASPNPTVCTARSRGGSATELDCSMERYDQCTAARPDRRSTDRLRHDTGRPSRGIVDAHE